MKVKSFDMVIIFLTISFEFAKPEPILADCVTLIIHSLKIEMRMQYYAFEKNEAYHFNSYVICKLFYCYKMTILTFMMQRE